MIINHEAIKRKFKCNDIVGDYLLRNFNLPVLSVDKGYYYFTDNEYFRECLKNLPLLYKIFMKL